LKKVSETKGPIVSIKASEDVQPLIKYVLSRIDKFRSSLMGLEKKVEEMKHTMRELEEESLSNFRAEEKEGGNVNDDG